MTILGIITARGGSKGVPRKNLASLADRPLLSYTIEAALGAKRLSRVILTTDDQEIAQVGRAWGVDVPFIRPAELAQDDTPTLPVLQHAVRFLEGQGQKFEAICLLQPTNPLRSADDIDACAALLESSGADAVVTVLPVPHVYNPHWVYSKDSQGLLSLVSGESAPIARRQDLPPAFHREGSVYITRRDVLMEKNSLYGSRLVGYLMDAERSVNIDTFEDLARAARVAESRSR